MKRIILLVAVAACAQEPQQGHAPLGTAKVPYLFSPSTGESKRPTLLVLPGGGDPGASYKQWSSAIPQGWTVLMPLVPGLSDAGAKAVEAVLGHATEPAGIDRSRVYLAGAGSATPEVFYTLARLPGLFAAALAVEGNPMPAVNSNRLFAINTQLSPLLWVNPPEGLETVQTKLKDAEYRFEIAKNLGTMQIFQWLFQNQLAQNPLKVDCETHSPSFARCFWVEVSQFNLKKKNDVVPSTRVQPGTGASLDLGGFGYDPKAPGPGLLVAWLPDDYKGPLKLNDRILSVGGRDIANARDYMDYIDTVPEAKQTAVVVERGAERLRLETKFILPVREQTFTARMKAEYTPEQKEVLLITRSVSAAKIYVPDSWEIARILWNGYELTPDKSRCLQLLDKDGEATVQTCAEAPKAAP